MRKSRFSEEQIAMALRQGEAGTPVEEICRKLGISDATYFRWKRKYGGLGLSELRELRQLSPSLVWFLNTVGQADSYPHFVSILDDVRVRMVGGAAADAAAAGATP